MGTQISLVLLSYPQFMDQFRFIIGALFFSLGFFSSAYSQIVIPHYQFDYTKCLPVESYDQKMSDITIRQNFLFQQARDLDKLVATFGHDLEQLNSAHLMAKQLSIYSGILSIAAAGIVFAATFTGVSALDVAGLGLAKSTTIQLALSSSEALVKVRTIAGLKLGKDFLDLLVTYYISGQSYDGIAEVLEEKNIVTLNRWILAYPFYAQNLGDYIDDPNRINPKLIESPYLSKLEEHFFKMRETLASELKLPGSDFIETEIKSLQDAREKSDSSYFRFFLYRQQLHLELARFSMGAAEFFTHNEQKNLAFEYDSAVLYREIISRRIDYFSQIKKTIDLVKESCHEGTIN